MNPTVSYVLLTLLILVAAAIPAGYTHDYQQTTVRDVVFVYLARCAAMALVAAVIGGFIFLQDPGDAGALRAFKVGVVILIPTGIAAAAMWRISRTPTLEELNHQELRKEQQI